MWPVIMAAARTYAPYITLPAAAIIGFVGYNLEWAIRKEKNTPFRVNSTMEDRNERKLREIDQTDVTQVDSLKAKKDIPKTILGRNENFDQNK